MEIGGRLTFEGDPLGNDLVIRGRVQYRIRTKILKSDIVWVHVFSNKMAGPFMEGLL